MDKYEFKLSLNEINELIKERRFEEAADIADGIDWNHVKSADTLCRVSEVYKAVGDYTRSRDVLSIAHKREPENTRISYALCELTIYLYGKDRMQEDLTLALQLLREFREAEPDNPRGLILQYKMFGVSSVSTAEKIGVLEQLHEESPSARWDYELAKLYAANGDTENAAKMGRQIVKNYSGKFVQKTKDLLESIGESAKEKEESALEKETGAKPEKAESVPEEREQEPASELKEADQSGREATAEPEPEPEQIKEVTLQVRREEEKESAKEQKEEEKEPVKEQKEENEIPAGTEQKIQQDPLPLQEPVKEEKKNVSDADVIENGTLEEILARTLKSQTATAPQSSAQENTAGAGGSAPNSTAVNAVMEEWEKIRADIRKANDEKRAQRILEDTGTLMQNFDETARHGLLEDIEKGVAKQRRQVRSGMYRMSDALPEDSYDARDSYYAEDDREDYDRRDTAYRRYREEEDYVREASPRRRYEEDERFREEVNRRREYPEDEDYVRDEPPRRRPREDEEYIREARRRRRYEEDENLPGEEMREVRGRRPYMQEDPENRERTSAKRALDEEEEIRKAKALRRRRSAGEEDFAAVSDKRRRYEEEVSLRDETASGEDANVQKDAQNVSGEKREDDTRDVRKRRELEEEREILREKKRSNPDTLESDAEHHEDVGETTLRRQQSTGTPRKEFSAVQDGRRRVLMTNEDDDVKVYGRTQEIDEVATRRWNTEEIHRAMAREERLMREEERRKVKERAQRVQVKEEEYEEQKAAQNENPVREEDFAEGETIQRRPAAGRKELPEVDEECFYEEAPDERVTDEAALEEEIQQPSRRAKVRTSSAYRDEEISQEGEVEKEEPVGEESVHRQPLAPAGAVKAPEQEQSAPEKKPAPISGGAGAKRVLTKDERRLFGAFCRMEDNVNQLTEALDQISLASSTGNVIILGNEVTALRVAKGILEIVRQSDANFTGNIARTVGASFNKLDSVGFAKTFAKLENGALIITKAADIAPKAMERLYHELEEREHGVILIITDGNKRMEQFKKENESYLGSFTALINIRPLDDKALVAYARDYALSQDYSIDEFGQLALAQRINVMQTSTHHVTLTEVRNLVDEAISYASRKTPHTVMEILSKRRYDENDRIILHEKDFTHN